MIWVGSFKSLQTIHQNPLARMQKTFKLVSKTCSREHALAS